MALLVAVFGLASCASPPPSTPVVPAAQPPVRVAVPEAPPPASVQAPVEGTIEIFPPLPRTRLDPAQDGERRNLWGRVREGFAMPELNNELVRKWEQWYAARPDYVQRMTERGGRYLFHIVEEVDKRGMPRELALLPFVESAFNPQAESSARAAGMWQFMPATGKDFELRQNLFRDDRRSVLASTRAALDYLQRLHTLFGGDWQLALAAYNWGQGNVLRAIDHNRRAGLPTSYSDLRMPDETRNYVPKLQAVKNIVARPEAFALTLPLLENHPFFLSVTVDRDIDVALAAQLSGLRLEDFLALNPQMNKPVILAAGTPQLLLPYDNANRYLREVAKHRGALASWTAWVAPRTVQPAEAARLIGMPEADLRAINRIPPRMLVKAGSTLLVPRGALATTDVTGSVADSAAMLLAPEPRPLRRVNVVVGRKGDSVTTLAQRHKVSPALLAQWNQVGVQARFKPGQRVVLMVPAAAAKTAGQAVAGRRAIRQASQQASKPGSQQAGQQTAQRASQHAAKHSAKHNAKHTAKPKLAAGPHRSPARAHSARAMPRMRVAQGAAAGQPPR